MLVTAIAHSAEILTPHPPYATAFLGITEVLAPFEESVVVLKHFPKAKAETGQQRATGTHLYRHRVQRAFLNVAVPQLQRNVVEVSQLGRKHHTLRTRAQWPRMPSACTPKAGKRRKARQR
jgi:hypothetical protein